MPFSPTRHRVALMIAIVGMAFAVFTEVVHQQMGTGSALGRICELGGVVKCDMVIGSRWGQFLGFPVAVWGAGAFFIGAALALPGALGGPSPMWSDLGLLAITSWSVGFAAVLATVMLGVIGYVCVFCLTMDAIILSWFVTVLPLARRFKPQGWVTVLASATLAILSGTFSATRGPAVASTVDQVRVQDARFYEKYMALPVRTGTDLNGDARHAKGPVDAPVTIVEFSDFECPACGMAFGALRSFLHGRTDIRFIFRHFPLDSACNSLLKQPLHADACAAAIAAECAGGQDKFWAYHDQLFTHQEALDRESLFRYAREVGLDVATFRACLDDPATLARVKDDIAAGAKAELHSTPTFYINGRQIDGMPDAVDLEHAILIEREAIGAAPHKP